MIHKQVKLYKDRQYYNATLTIEEGKLVLENDTYRIEKTGDFFFVILSEIRKVLEVDGAILLLNGSRKDVYPSGMSLIGNMAYIQQMGKPSRIVDLVDIFEETDRVDLISTVQDQLEFHDQWLKSLK